MHLIHIGGPRGTCGLYSTSFRTSLHFFHVSCFTTNTILLDLTLRLGDNDRHLLHHSCPRCSFNERYDILATTFPVVPYFTLCFLTLCATIARSGFHPGSTPPGCVAFSSRVYQFFFFFPLPLGLLLRLCTYPSFDCRAPRVMVCVLPTLGQVRYNDTAFSSELSAKR